MAFVTLNNLIAVFESIAQRHEMINAFGYGDDWEVGVSKAEVHPVLWINPILGRLPKGQNGYSEYIIEFNVKVFDLVQKDEGNEQEVLSDTFEILKDVVNEFSSHPYYIEGGFDLDGDLVLTPFTESFDEEVSGWEVTISPTAPNHRSFCSSPIDPIQGWEFLPNGCTIVNTTCLEVNQDICVTGDIIASGDVTATTYYGDGSNLTGITGTSGFSGFSGFSGIGTSGFSGAQGTSGFSGQSATGVSGFSGFSGYSGVSGYSGIGTQGPIGTSGFSGVSGYSGFSGLGTSGFSGFSGFVSPLFYIAVNFEAIETWTYVAPEQFTINTVVEFTIPTVSPDTTGYVIQVNGGSYTLGNTISLYDVVTITVTTTGFVKLNCTL